MSSLCIAPPKNPLEIHNRYAALPTRGVFDSAGQRAGLERQLGDFIVQTARASRRLSSRLNRRSASRPPTSRDVSCLTPRVASASSRPTSRRPRRSFVTRSVLLCARLGPRSALMDSVEPEGEQSLGMLGSLALALISSPIWRRIRPWRPARSGATTSRSSPPPLYRLGPRCRASLNTPASRAGVRC